MGDKHVVRFEPVGIEIEVGEDQTILRAAAEQGIMLMHGCKEGQCAACKSFILEGEDVEHDRYSTFALPDYEKDEGFTLLCRAHAYEDLTIDNGYRVDLLVEDCVVVELKAIEQVLPVHRGQLLSYLRLGGYKLGFLLNFNVPLMRDGITRLVNGL